MTDLRKFLNTTRAKINELKYGGRPRTYLGMSGLAHHCQKYLFYNFHWASIKKHDSRKERIFNIGHLFEVAIIQQLKDAGFEVYKVIDGEVVEHFGYPDEPQEEYIGFAKHAKGHSDGRILGVIEAPLEEHLLEVKTAKKEKFKEFEDVGVKKANSVYYGQTQRYMKAAKLKWCLFIVLNKNTSHLYIERIPLDEKFAHDLIRKEQSIIMTDIVPYSDYPKNYYKCNMCDNRELCHGEIEPSVNCRTCKFCDVENDGGWSCAKQDHKLLSTQEQRDGCSKYFKGWDL